MPVEPLSVSWKLPGTVSVAGTPVSSSEAGASCANAVVAPARARAPKTTATAACLISLAQAGFGRPVEFRDRAAGDDDVALARDVVHPEGVRALADAVEYRGVGRVPIELTLEHVLVATVMILPGGADLDL